MSSLVTLAGYEFIDLIHESYHSWLFRGFRCADNKPVILKALKTVQPSREQIAWYKREYQVTQQLAQQFLGSGIAAAYTLEMDGQRPVIVLEDFGGQSLSQFVLAEKLTVQQFLSLAIAITEILGQIHAAHIIHKDINPSNIVLNPQTQQVKIIDFGISTVLSRETQSFKNLNVLEGTVGYISPEQTGRMNRAIDYRSDFYSLGVTFYELLTGQLPFAGEDVLAIVHGHLAKQPPTLAQLKAEEQSWDIPTTLFDIVLKMMAKNAEDRYQSAYGIQFDLQQCLEQWQQTGAIVPFPLASQDRCDRFTIPQKLYGRAQEVQELLAAFERIAVAGTTELVLVAGYSGTGKSALVHEVHQPITLKRGLFIAGKYDQYQRNIPYSAIAQAFTGFCDLLLAETEISLKQWQTKILAAIGSNGQVLIEVIPRLERVLGIQPPVPQVDAQAAQNRFNFVFQNFLKAISHPDHPLVLFIDDLQWVDSASLSFLKTMLSNPEIQSLLVVAAYRDNEVDATHPAMLMVEELRKVNQPIAKVQVNNLTHQHVSELVADTLRCSIEQGRDLAHLICRKTHGNAFFSTEFLKSLYSESLLRFDLEQQCWQWDLPQIEAKGMTDNVVDLMATKVQTLPQVSQGLLQLAACIGSHFDLTTLRIISERSTRSVLKALLPALQEGFLVPLSDRYKLVSDEEFIANDELLADNTTLDYNSLASQAITFRFQHDRVQQAVYSLIAKSQRQQTHLNIGRLLWQSISLEEVQGEHLFTTANQFNQGLNLVTEPHERLQLATLNLYAGQKAKAASAHIAALNYLIIGMELLPDHAWKAHYDLTLALYTEATEAAFLSGDFEALERFAEPVIRFARIPLDTAKVEETRIAAYTMQGKLAEAVNTAFEIVGKFGIAFPTDPTDTEFQQAFQRVQDSFQGRSPADLLALPTMTDPQALAAVKILGRVAPAVYMVKPVLYTFVTFEQVYLSATYGNATASTGSYTDYGLILCGLMGDIPTGYAFGQLALNILTRFNDKKYEARVLLVMYKFVAHWMSSVQDSLEPLKQAYISGLENGDLAFAGYAASTYGYHAYFLGMPLVELEQEIRIYGQALVNIQQTTAFNYNTICHNAVLSLLGQTKQPDRLDETAEELLATLETAGDRLGVWRFWVNKGILCYYLQQFEGALSAFMAAAADIASSVGLLSVPLFYTYDSLTRLALYPTRSQEEQVQDLARIADNQTKLDTWATHAPMNHRHKWHLVEAERYRVLQQFSLAMEHYDLAIALAQENRFLNEAALASELTAQFYLAWGKEMIGQAYLRNAFRLYQQWEATAKLKDLTDRYPHYFRSFSSSSSSSSSSLLSSSSSQSIDPPTHSTVKTTATLSTTLDLSSVLKASQSLAQEIKLETLLTKLMTIVLENAGAEIGHLLLQQDDQWIIAASGTLTHISIYLGQPQSLEQLPQSILNYVIRTQESVVLDHAAHTGQFSHYPDIIERQSKSILCSPLMNQGKLIGIVYLENNLSIGAFTTDRLEILNLLSAQAAVSIENALLYATLEDKVTQRTQELSQALTDLKVTQAKLVESEKMAALGNLVAGVAHEINTPLGTSITLASSLADETRMFVSAIAEGQIKRSLLNNYTSLAQESTQLLLSNLQRAGDLVQSFKQVAVDQVNLDHYSFNLKHYVEEIVLSFEPKLKQTPHHLMVLGDNTLVIDNYPGAIAQLITNLLNNSLMHAYPTGTPGQLQINIQPSSSGVVLAYRDDGCGIPPNLLDKIFDPFFTTARDRGGSGLGLHIVYNLVTQKLGGTVSVESEVGVGTLFTIHLPWSL